MPTPKPPNQDDGSPSPATPRRASAAKKGNNVAGTPNRRTSGAAGTPKSAPATGGVRKRSNSKAEAHTLLHDFLVGRPSPARAQQQRRKSLDAVKTEMRQSSVKKLQPPGGVKDRVKQWQKTNSKAMVKGDPMSTPSEPTDVAFLEEEESVTEEDRIRIKMRQKKRPMPKVVVHNEDDNEDEEEAAPEEIPEDPRLRGPPKKRVISDDHWMKKKANKSPPRGVSPKVAKESSPSPIPKDFLQRTAPSPPVAKKVQDWATKVELPDSPPPKQYKSAKPRDSGDGIRVKPMAREASPKELRAEDEDIHHTPRKHSRHKIEVDDGIRVAPIRKKRLDDDGIRVRSLTSNMPDDGIRVRPSRERSRPPSASRRDQSPSERTEMAEEPLERVEVIEESETEIDTPTKKGKSHGKTPVMGRTRTQIVSSLDDATDDQSWVSASDPSSRQHTIRDGSDLASSALGKSLADIPFGYSAFSELDLPLGADAHTSRRPKAQRNPSFKAVTKGLKKVVTEGKKIIHDTVDPPKPVVNQPPSIENWLSGTVDPFVDVPTGDPSPAPARKSIETEWAQETHARRRSSTEAKLKKSSPPPESGVSEENEENVGPKVVKDDVTPKAKAKTPTSAGLKRSRATRSSSSPLKSAGKPGGRKPFREALKEAFKGESSGHIEIHPLNNYVSQEDRGYERTPDEDDWEDDRETRRRSSGSRSSPPSDEAPPPPEHSEPPTPIMTGPRRRPPTNGMHELSTIVSVESLSTRDSDADSSISHTTVTQSTALTKESELSRQRSQKSGLKRRLTKHSDLVSVLSLPDDSQVSEGLRNVRSRPSLRRARSKLDHASVQDLLKEFEEDENLYQRELKTLVDGVVPVLLTQVVHGDSGSAVNLFGADSPNRKADAMSKAVVNMGVALEKMKKCHRKAPLYDAPRLAAWLATIVPVYDSYLDAWRLGFQNLIVNLAPAADRLDDEDSLLNAMPRNENGDVLGSDGERVDVAHLLKRPLIRIKLMAKFAKVGYPAHLRHHVLIIAGHGCHSTIRVNSCSRR
jgi:hypothetical protein